MKPVTNAECVKFADLILRSMFFLSLNDEELQKAITDLKVDNPTLKSFLDEAVAAESRRKCRKDIATSSSSLDSTSGVSISKWDTAFHDKKFHKGQKNRQDSRKPVEAAAKKDNTAKTQTQYSDKTQKPSTENQNTHNKNSNKSYCKNCKIKGHWTSDCRKLKAKLAKTKQIKNVSHESEEFDDDFGPQPNSNTICLVDSDNVILNKFASGTKEHPLVTMPPIKTSLRLENCGNLLFEVDTGASHNIISQKCFDQLQLSLKNHGKQHSRSLPRTVKIRLANGSMDPSDCKVVQIKVSTNLNSTTLLSYSI